MKKLTALFALFLPLMLAVSCVHADDAAKAEPNLNDASKYGQIISSDATIRISSANEGDRPEHHLQLLAGPVVNNAFTTDGEKNPWVIITLSKEKSITGIHIVDAVPGIGTQLTPAKLQISLSTDGKSWNKVWESEEWNPSLDQKKDWNVSLIKGFFPQYHARYIKIELLPDDKTKFSLSRVTVYGM